jgi:peptide/nickel transport system substrate-binding protein
MRKHVFLSLAVLIGMLILVACTGQTATPTTAPATATTAPTTVPPTAIPVSKYAESPMLKNMEVSGTLPPVDKRLPDNPRVVANLSGEKGVYGGELRVGFVGSSPEWGGMLWVSGLEGLLNWKSDFSGYEYNMAESIDVSTDVTQYTIHLRKGIRWSDGEPYTADDIMFFIEDYLYDPDLNAGGNTVDWLPTTMYKDFKAVKIDDYTVKFTFPKPYGTFMYSLNAWTGRYFAMYPKHYLKQFHKKYNPNVDAMVAEEAKTDSNITDWTKLFFKKGPDTWANPGRYFTEVNLPSLYPWVTTQPLGAGTQVRMVRNPYYWKTDAAGNQLPYIDTVVGISYQNSDSRTLAMLNGDLDYIKDPSGSDRILFHDAVAAGKPLYIRYPLPDGANVNSIHFNQTLADPVKAEIFANKDFRIGMSYAINRPEIIEIVFNGQGTPAQVAPLETSPFYIKGMDTQYVEYDVAKANEYLDKVVPDKDAQGFRLDKDGKRLKIIYTVQNDLGYGTYYVQLAELLLGYWKKVGIDMTLNSVTGQVYEEARKKNQIEATLTTGEGGAGLTPLLDPRYYAPFSGFSIFGNGWTAWKTPDPSGGSVVVEPPQWAKDAYAKYELVLQQPTQELQIAKMKLVIQEAMDRFYVIGIARPATLYYPINSRLHGIPETWIDGWNEGSLKLYQPEQWFIKA